jgi:DNA-binding beta-propeller fold protein YncE
LFIADTMNGGMYRFDAAAGQVAAFVGAGAPFPGVTQLYCLAFSPGGGDLYYTAPNEVRVVDLATTTAKPSVAYAAARVIAIDSKGTLYAVKNRPNGRVLHRVDAAGRTTDMAGTSGVISDPKHITCDGDGNVLLADTELQLIRRYVVATQTLMTIAGTGVLGTGMLDGAPERAQFRRPHGIFVDPLVGSIYIADSENNRVLKITR